MKSTFLQTILIVLLLCCNAIINHANAGLIVFTDRDSWLTAIGTPDYTENYNKFIGDIRINDQRGPYSVSGVTYQDSGYGSIYFDKSPFRYDATGIDGTTFLSIIQYRDNSFLTITLPEYVSAFGWDTLNYDYQDQQVIINIAGKSYQATPEKTCGKLCTAKGFFGVIATGATTFNSLIVTAGSNINYAGLGTYGGFDNLAYKVNAVPEPSTLAIFALVMIALSSRRLAKNTFHKF